MANRLKALQTNIGSFENQVRVLNGDIRELNQKQTVIYGIKQSGEEQYCSLMG